MSNDYLSPASSEVPLGYARIELSAQEIDYLKSYWEIRNHGEIFAWGAKLLYDLSKLDQSGWRLTLSKAEVDENTKRVEWNPDYRQVVMLMKWLGPNKDGWARLPSAETLNNVMKITT